MTMNNENFCCAICGTTTPKYDADYIVLWRSDEGIVSKHICIDCLSKIQNDPRFLYCTEKTLPTSEYYEYELEEERKDQERRDEIFAHNRRVFDTYKNFCMERHIAGTKKFSGWVDVTDPCYGSQSYNGKQVYVADGEYTCVWWNNVYDEVSESSSKVWHNEEMDVMGIYLNGKIPAAQDMVYIGSGCIYGGRIGFFDIKENLRDAVDSARLVDANSEAAICDVGFVGNASDGAVSIYAYAENGKIVALEVRLFEYLPRV